MPDWDLVCGYASDSPSYTDITDTGFSAREMMGSSSSTPRLDKSLKGYATFEGWNKVGYRVKKGAKSTKRNKRGVPLFNKSQVYRKTND